jgi:hypothetical protein
MSVRCVGVQNLRTAPNAIIDGNSVVSVSLWVRLNTGSAAAPGDGLVFGRPGDNLFSTVVVGGTANLLRVQWLTDGNGASPLSSFDLNLATGDAVHLAATYRPGLQQYFVNGALVATDACASVLRPRAGAAASAPFQVGPGVVGPDVTVDEPTVWQGYELTPADVVNLRDRAVHPQGVAPGQIAWLVSLAGTDGAVPAVGDPGLADQGPNGLSVVAVTAPPPVYVGGVLTFDPPARLASASVCGSGASVALAFQGRAGSPSPLNYLTTNCVQSVRCAAVGGSFSVSFQGQTTGPLPAGTPPDAVQAALAGLPSVGAGNVSVSGFGTYRVEFTGALGGVQQPLLTAAGSGLLTSLPGLTGTGGASAATVQTTDPGFAKFGGGWVGSGEDARPTQLVMAQGTSANYCVWTFSGLTPGNYGVSAFGIDPPGGGFSGVSFPARQRYRVYDGTAFAGTAVVNPLVPPGTSGAFVPLGTFRCSSGTLKVILADDADAGGGVMACDVKVGPPSGSSPTDTASGTVSVTSLLPGGPPTVKVNGGPSQPLGSAVIWGDYDAPSAYRRLDWAVYPTPVKVNPGDTVTVSFGTGAFVTASGPVQGVTDVAVTNHSGGSPLPPPPSSRTMKVGYNVAPAYFDTPACVLSNLVKFGIERWSNYSVFQQSLALDPTGYPTAATGESLNRYVLNSSPLALFKSGYPLAPFGDYTLVWDGPGNCSLNLGGPRPGCSLASGRASIGTEYASEAVTGQATNNLRTYNFPAGAEVATADGTTAQLSPYLQLLYDNHTQPGPRNVRLYPPGVLAVRNVIPPGGPPKINPRALQLLQGCKVIRSMLWMWTNGSTWSDEHDFYGQNDIAYYPGGAGKYTPVQVTKVETYQPGAGPFAVPERALVKFTTAAPHNLKTGWWLSHGDANGLINYNPLTVNLTAGGTAQVYPSSGICYVLDATTYLLQGYISSNAPWAPVLNPGLYTIPNVGAPPPEDLMDVCAALPGCDWWQNVMCSCTDSAATYLGTLAAAHLAPGTKVIFEFANEVWNNLFNVVPYAAVQGYAKWPNLDWGTRGLNWIVMRSAQLWKLFKAAWNAAGRTEPVYHVFNTWATSPSFATAMLNAAASMDDQGRPATDPNFSGVIHVDGIAISPYYNTSPQDTLLPKSTFDNLTLERLMDVGDCNFAFPTFVSLHTNAAGARAACLASNYPNPSSLMLLGYEGGPNYNGLLLLTASANDEANSVSYPKHPRTYGQMTASFADHQALGFSYYCVFELANVDGQENVAPGVNPVKNYGTYHGLNLRAGRGDGSGGGVDNRPLIADGTTGLAKLPDLSGVVSVVAQAVQDWNAPPLQPTNTAQPPRRTPGRSSGRAAGPRMFHPGPTSPKL